MCVIIVMYYYVLSCCHIVYFFVFFKQKTAYEMRISDWSSDVCSSDLVAADACVAEQCDPLRGGHAAEQALAFGIVRDRLGIAAGLAEHVHRHADQAAVVGMPRPLVAVFVAVRHLPHRQRVVAAVGIGRASCRARVCQYV